MTDDDNSTVNKEDEISEEVNFLSEKCIRLWNTWNDNYSDIVPPSSPRNDINFDIYETLPYDLPNVQNLKIPYIREIGIKATIDKLGEYFRCNNYKVNLLHFWFLDVITDCLWRVQDEFSLIESDQKVVLEWIIFVFNLIRDPKLNYDRKTVFRVIKEVILLICDIISENNCQIPLPENLFNILSKSNSNNGSESLDTNDVSSLLTYSLQSTISNLTYDKASSYIEFNIDDKRKRYKLGKQACNCHTSVRIDESSQDSSFKSSESVFSAYLNDTKDVENVVEETEDNVETSEEELQFYVADTSLPIRFKPIEAYENYVEKEYPKPLLYADDDWTNIEEQESYVEQSPEDVAEEEFDLGLYEITDDAYKELTKPKSAEELVLNLEILSDKIEVIKAPPQAKPSIVKNFSTQISGVNAEEIKLLNTNEEMISGSKDNLLENDNLLKESNDNLSQNESNKQELIQQLTKLKRLEYRMKQMDDSKEGLIPTPSNVSIIVEPEIIFIENEIDPEWLDIDEEVDEQYAKCQDIKFINFNVLHAIIDFIFEYFYENFHFTLIKLAYQFPLSRAIQNCNEIWSVPKIPKGELIKPKEQKTKKGKKEKGKKSKKDKSKKSKSSKTSKKSNKNKSSKKSKSSKMSKSSKSSKKGKKKGEKKRKVTKEEKAEFERLKKEQELLEEVRRKMEENRRNLFPLIDAASDDLFKGIFQNWVKVDLEKRGKKDKKSKKNKKAKK